MQILNERPEPGLEPYIGDFLVKRKAEVLELKEALKNNDFNLLKSYAHNWKGFSRPYGFIMLEDFAVELEKTSNEKNLEASLEIIKKVDEYLILKSEVDFI